MSTLFVNTIKPDSGSNVLVSASLIVSESLKVAGDFELSGSIKLGNADTDSVGFIADVSSSILPDANETFDLGSISKKWRHLHAVGITSSGDISSSGTIIGNIGQFNELDFGAFTNITASGDISTSGAFIGDGSQLTGIGISGSAIDALNITASGISMSQGEIVGGTASLAHLNMISGNAFFNQVAIGTSPDPTASYGFHLFSETSPIFIIEGDADGGAIDETKIQFRARNYPAATAPIWSVGIGAIGDNGIGEDGSQGANTSLFFTNNLSITGSTPTLALQVGNPDGFGNAVGINTSQPTVALQVEGGISASGTGSFEHLAIVGEISGAVSASGTGSFIGGVDATAATGSFGYISASGDVSTSGTGSFEHLIIAGEITSNVSSSGTGSFQGGIESPNATGSFAYISSSGDISSSASGSFMHLSVSGSGSMTYLFISASDQLNTAISASGGISASYFSGDGRHLENVTASFVAGGTTAAGSDTQLQFNDGGALGADAGLLYNKTTDVLSVSGSIIVGNGLGHVSASRVSASAGFEADTLSTSSFGYISCSGDITSSGTGSFAGGINCISTGGDDVDGTGSFGYISCSGDISISGDFFSTNITASGNISSSIIKGQQVQAQEGDNLGFRFNLNDNSQVNAIRYKTIGERAHLQIPSLPTSVTNPFTASATALVGGNLTVGGTATVTGTTTTNGTLNAAGGFQIGGTAVTATATELNKMDGFVGTTDQLNTLIKSADAEIEASKAVKYDSDGAIVTKRPIRSDGKTLTVGESNTLLVPTGSTGQTFTLPAAADAKGVRFDFLAGSAQTHRIVSPSSDIVGQIIDNSNGNTLARTEIDGASAIALQNPKIGDRITIISDGSRYYVEGRTNDTPATS